MNGPPPPETIYLTGVSEPVFANFHAPAGAAVRDVAVLLCPPFGWDEVCSYRGRRRWAGQLAQSGYATLRLTLPGTGDSAGAPRDADRLEAWTATVDEGARWLLRASGARRLAAIGMGLGGALAYRAAAAGAPIDDLVLWATPARARALVRQLRAFSKLEGSQMFEGLTAPPPLPAGELEAGGFLLSAQTIDELDRLDLTAIPLAEPERRRMLLLERDRIAVDARLLEHLQRSGAAVTIAPGGGYAEMTSHPQRARPALGVFERVREWLHEGSAPTRTASETVALAPGARRSAEIRLGGAVIARETAVSIEQPFGALSGVLVEPVSRPQHGLCAVLLNAGAMRRIGPSRMWVEAARRWAQLGVATLRLDVEGIGEADGDETPYGDDGGLYVAALVPQVLAALDFLQDRGVGERFVLAGLCAGAYWAFHAALCDDRVCASLMVNPRALIWDTDLAPARDLRALRSQPPSFTKIRREATPARIMALARWLLAAPRRRLIRLSSPDGRGAVAGAELDALLARLQAKGKRALLLFSEHEPLHEELVNSGRMSMLEQWPSVTIEHIAVRDHTLRPNWAQGQAHAALDRALHRELRLSPSTEPAPSGLTSRAPAKA